MRRLWTLVFKDFRTLLSDPVAVGLSLVVPLVMIVVFGLVFGRTGEEALHELYVLAVNEDHGPAGRRLLRDLDRLDEICIVEKLKGDTISLDSTRARRRVEIGRNSAALIVPRDFSEGLKNGEVRLHVLEDPRDPVAAGVTLGMLQRQVFSTFPGLLPMSMMKGGYARDSTLTRRFNEDLRQTIRRNFGRFLPDTSITAGLFPEAMVLGSDPDTSARADTSGFNFDKALSGLFKVKREAVVGQNIVNPGIAQSVAGPAVLFLLFAVGAIAGSLLREMHSGTAQRLLVSGVRRSELLASKYVYSVVFGTGQLIVMMLFGWILFRLDIWSHSLVLLVMIFCAVVACSGVALFVAALSRTQEQAAGLQIVLNLSMSAIGGAMFPSFMIPPAVRTLAMVTPVHWAMQGFLDVFWRNQGFAGIVLEGGILLGMGLVLVTVSMAVFFRRLKLELG